MSNAERCKKVRAIMTSLRASILKNKVIIVIGACIGVSTRFAKNAKKLFVLEPKFPCFHMTQIGKRRSRV